MKRTIRENNTAPARRVEMPPCCRHSAPAGTRSTDGYSRSS